MVRDCNRAFLDISPCPRRPSKMLTSLCHLGLCRNAIPAFHPLPPPLSSVLPSSLPPCLLLLLQGLEEHLHASHPYLTFQCSETTTRGPTPLTEGDEGEGPTAGVVGIHVLLSVYDRFTARLMGSSDLIRIGREGAIVANVSGQRGRGWQARLQLGENTDRGGNAVQRRAVHAHIYATQSSQIYNISLLCQAPRLPSFSIPPHFPYHCIPKAVRLLTQTPPRVCRNSKSCPPATLSLPLPQTFLYHRRTTTHVPLTPSSPTDLPVPPPHHQGRAG